MWPRVFRPASYVQTAAGVAIGTSGRLISVIRSASGVVVASLT